MRYLENKESKCGLFCATRACNGKRIINFIWPNQKYGKVTGLELESLDPKVILD